MAWKEFSFSCFFWTAILMISAFHVARITGMSHRCPERWHHFTGLSLHPKTPLPAPFLFLVIVLFFHRTQCLGSTCELHPPSSCLI
jgi:hypothetical protein